MLGGWAQSFSVNEDGYLSRIVVEDGNEFDYDPIWLEAGNIYALDMATGVLMQHIVGNHLECIAKPKPKRLH
jgi:hypothetical protein